MGWFLTLLVALLAFMGGVVAAFYVWQQLSLYEIQFSIERKGGPPITEAAEAEPPPRLHKRSKKEKKSKRRKEEPPSFLQSSQIARQGWLEMEKLKGQFIKRWFVLGSGWLLCYKTENTQTPNSLYVAVALRKAEVRAVDTRVFCVAFPLRKGRASEHSHSPLVLRAKDERDQKEWITAIEITKHPRHDSDESSSAESDTVKTAPSSDGKQREAPLDKAAAGRLEVVQGIKKKLSGMLPPDTEERLLWRFAKARGWDVDRASQAILTYLAWRQDYGAGPDLTPHLGALLPIIQKKLCYLHGYNKRGEPCIIGFPAHYNPKEMPTPHIVRFAVCVLETAIAAMKPPIETFCVIFDYTGLGWSNVDQAMLKELINVMGQYYVERLGSLYLLNATWVVHALFKVFKPLIDPATREKLHFINNNEELLNFFDRDTLPVALGGTSTQEPEGSSIGQETLQAQPATRPQSAPS